MVCFVNDDLSAAALRKGLEGGNLEVRRGTIRNAIRMLETDTEFLALVADISDIGDPFTELERLSRVCPADVRVAVIGENTEIVFYRVLMDLGLSEYLPKPLTRDLVQTQLSPKLLGDVAPDPTDAAGMSSRSAAPRAAPEQRASRSISRCCWPRRPRPRWRCSTSICKAARQR